MKFYFLPIILWAATTPLLAQNVDHETLSVIGWNNACSIALVHSAFPVLGTDVVDDPISARVAKLTIAPGEIVAKTESLLWLDGSFSWKPAEVKAAVENLKKAGYGESGYQETIRPDPIGPQPGLEELLLSTQAFSASAPSGWPSPEFRLSKVFYSPLTTCALLTYRRADAPKDFFAYALTRVGDPRVRTVRSRAHVSNGLLLLKDGDIEGALAETKISAAVAPDHALARYHHAALLSLTGSLEEALRELGEAISRDKKYRALARQNKDFDSLWKDKRFKVLTRER